MIGDLKQLGDGSSIVTFETAYPRIFIPKGGRNPRTEFPIASDVAVIRTPARSEIRTAFRVTYPTSDFPPIPVYSRQQLFGYAKARSPVTVELVEFEGCVWWQVWRSEYDQPGGKTLLEAVDWLGLWGDDLAAVVPRNVCTVATPSAAREVIRDEMADTLAVTKRAIFSNLISVDGVAYVRGGMPVFAEIRSGGRKLPRIRVIPAGIGRDAMPIRAGVFSPPALGGSSEAQAALYEGRFWSPASRQQADKIRPRSQRDIPIIEIVHFECDDMNMRNAQLDALFRECRRRVEMDWARYFRPAKQIRADLGEVFAAAAETKTHDYSTSLARLRALNELFAHANIGEHAMYISELRSLKKKVVASFDPEPLADEDQAAIDSYLGSAG